MDQILSNDVIISSEHVNQNAVLTEVLDKHDDDINQLQSNVKWLYKYGGVGGKGNGTGPDTLKSFSLVCNINNTYSLYKGVKPIAVNGTGQYNINVTIGRPQGLTYRVTATFTYKDKTSGKDKNNVKSIDLSFEKGYDGTIQLDFPNNGILYIKATCSGELEPQDLSAEVITNPYTFALSTVHNNHKTQYVSNELMIDTVATNGLVFKFDYSLGVDAILHYTITDTTNTIEESLKTGDINAIGVNREGTLYLQIDPSFFIYQNAGTYNFRIDVLFENYNTHDVEKIDAIKNNLNINYFLIPNSLFLAAYGEKESTRIYSFEVEDYNEELYNEYVELINKKSLYEQDKTNPEFTIEDQEHLDAINNKITFVTNGVIGIKCKSYDGIYKGNTFFIGDNDHRGYIKIKYQNEDSEVEEYININKISTLEQEIFTITPYIPHTGKVALELTLQYNNTAKTFTYYLYLVNSVHQLDWYNSTLFNPVEHNYYRSGSTTSGFNSLVSQPYVYSYSALTSNKLFVEYTPGSDTKNEMLIHIGIQYNKVNPKINNESPKILEIISVNEVEDETQLGNDKKIILYQDKIIYEGEERSIYIPNEQDFDSAVYSKYHLITIAKRLVNVIGNTFYFEVSIYIDGILENTILSYTTTSLVYYKVMLCPANFSINLFEIVYGYRESLTKYDANDNIVKVLSFVNDVTIAQYWEKFKQSYYNETNPNFLDYVDSLYELYKSEDIDNNNFKIALDDIQSIAKNVNVPTLILNIDLSNSDVNNFLSDWFTIDYESAPSVPKMSVNNIMWGAGKELAKEIENTEGSWYIEPQGTSTLARKVKNLNLGIISEDREVIFTPNFSMEDTKSFLPENSFTLKADIVDSTHSNNTSIGLFVNTVTTPFANAQQSSSIYKNHIKNCLVGFPILLYIGCKKTSGAYEYSYYGIYNFNLGRESYYNLGYKPLSALDSANIHDGFGIYSIAKVNPLPKLYVAEVREGNVTDDPYGNVFDFSQYYNNILILKNNKDKDIGMWSKIKVAEEVIGSTDKLISFVKSIAKAGGYIFKYLKKNFDETIPYGYNYGYKRSKPDDPTESLNYVPNFKYRAMRNTSLDNAPVYFELNNELSTTIESPDFLTIGKSWLDEAILKYNSTDENAALLSPTLDYESLMQYYVICMAFGLVDSVCKNLNIKSWNITDTIPKFYIAFYDMDTSLGKDNKGEYVSYFAFSDYWKANDVNELDGSVKAEKTLIYRDFFPTKTPNNLSGYDIPSSYLFAIAKYAILFYGNDLFFNKNDFKTPQDWWCELRGKDGYLNTAKNFIDNFFNKDFKNIPEALITYNYRFKYLWHGNTSFSETELKPMHGRGIHELEDWLSNRLHILDAYFNLCDVEDIIQYYDLSTQKWENTNIIEPALHSSVFNNETSSMKQNDDVTILTQAFTNEISSHQQQQTNVTNVVIKFKAPALTPGYLQLGVARRRMLFDNENKFYKLTWNTSGTQTYFLGGSKFWTELDGIEALILGTGDNASFTCVSDYMQKITANSGICKKWILKTPALQYLSLNGENFSGTLDIDSTLKNLISVDISDSKIKLSINQSNVVEVIAEGVESESLNISNCPHLNKLDLNNAKIKDINIDISVSNDIHLENVYFNSLNISGNGVNSRIYIEGHNESGNNNYQSNNINVTNIAEVYLNKCNNINSLVISPRVLKHLSITNSNFINFNNSNEYIWVERTYKTDGNGNTYLDTSVLHLENLVALESVSFENSTGFTKVIFPAGREIKLLYKAFSNTYLEYIDFVDASNPSVNVENGTLILSDNGTNSEAGNDCSIFRNSSFYLQSGDQAGSKTKLNFKVIKPTSLANIFYIETYNPSAIHNGVANILYRPAANFINNLDGKNYVTSLEYAFYNQKLIEGYYIDGFYSAESNNTDSPLVRETNGEYRIRLEGYDNLKSIECMLEGTLIDFVDDLMFTNLHITGEINIMNFIDYYYVKYMHIDAFNSIKGNITKFLFDGSNSRTQSRSATVTVYGIPATDSGILYVRKLIYDDSINSKINELCGLNVLNEISNYSNMFKQNTFTEYQIKNNEFKIHDIFNNLNQFNATSSLYRTNTKAIGLNEIGLTNLPNKLVLYNAFKCVVDNTLDQLKEEDLVDISKFIRFTPYNESDTTGITQFAYIQDKVPTNYKDNSNYNTFDFYKKIYTYKLTESESKSGWEMLWEEMNIADISNLFSKCLIFTNINNYVLSIPGQLDAVTDAKNLFKKSTIIYKIGDLTQNIGIKLDENSLAALPNLQNASYMFSESYLNGNDSYPFKDGRIFINNTQLTDMKYMFSRVKIIGTHKTYVKRNENNDIINGVQTCYNYRLNSGNDAENKIAAKNYKLNSVEYEAYMNDTYSGIKYAYEFIPSDLFTYLSPANSLQLMNMFEYSEFEGYLPSNMFTITGDERRLANLSNFVDSCKILPQLIEDNKYVFINSNFLKYKVSDEASVNLFNFYILCGKISTLGNSEYIYCMLNDSFNTSINDSVQLKGFNLTYPAFNNDTCLRTYAVGTDDIQEVNMKDLHINLYYNKSTNTEGFDSVELINKLFADGTILCNNNLSVLVNGYILKQGTVITLSNLPKMVLVNCGVSVNQSKKLQLSENIKLPSIQMIDDLTLYGYVQTEYSKFRTYLYTPDQQNAFSNPCYTQETAIITNAIDSSEINIYYNMIDFENNDAEYIRSVCNNYLLLFNSWMVASQIVTTNEMNNNNKIRWKFTGKLFNNFLLYSSSSSSNYIKIVANAENQETITLNKEYIFYSDEFFDTDDEQKTIARNGGFKIMGTQS